MTTLPTHESDTHRLVRDLQRLNGLQTGAGVAALIIMTVVGLILARSRRLGT
jgi:hypothetical protein